MRLPKLYKELGAILADGPRNVRVCIDKSTFHHNCESDGVTVLDVESIEVRWVPLSDDDGGIAVNSQGVERGYSCVVLYGNLHTPLTKRNKDRYRSSVDGFCANCGMGVTAHEPISGKCHMGITNRSKASQSSEGGKDK
jgi:hypothetical protein